MNMANTVENFDLKSLVQEAGAEIDALIKHEKERLETLKKSEESSSKEESSVEKNQPVEMKKDDSGSGFQSPAPEASSPSPEPSPSPESPQPEQSGENLQSMVQSLDDEMLNELMQVVQMEMQSRSQSQEPAPASPSPEPQASPSPSPSPEPSLEMAYKKEIDSIKEKLAKSEEQSKNVEKAFSAMTDLFDRMVNRPVTKAVTDIRDVDYIDKGEKALKKADQENISDEDLKKRLHKMATDRGELSKLNKNERDALSNYFVNKKRTPEVLKLINK